MESARMSENCVPLRRERRRGQTERLGLGATGDENKPREEAVEDVVDRRGGRKAIPRRRRQFDEIGTLDHVRVGLPAAARAFACPDVFESAALECADKGLL